MPRIDPGEVGKVDDLRLEILLYAGSNEMPTRCGNNHCSTSALRGGVRGEPVLSLAGKACAAPAGINIDKYIKKYIYVRIWMAEGCTHTWEPLCVSAGGVRNRVVSIPTYIKKIHSLCTYKNNYIGTHILALKVSVILREFNKRLVYTCRTRRL